MSEIKIEPINGNSIKKTVEVITSYFNVGVKKDGDRVIFVGPPGTIGEIRDILSAKIVGA